MQGGRPASNGSADDGGKMTKSVALTGANDGWCTDRHHNNGHMDVHGKYQSYSVTVYIVLFLLHCFIH
jgi:hypothetical protein